MLQHNLVIAAARIFLGVVFVFASIEKIADPNAFAGAIGYYKLVGPTIALWVATILPWIELLSGMCLIAGVHKSGSSFLILVMMIVFTAAVLSAIIRGLDISCGCFTRDPQVGRIGWNKVFENLGLLAVSWFLLVSRTDTFSSTIPDTL